MNLDEVKKTARNIGAPCVIPLVRILRNEKGLLPAQVYSLMDKKNASFLLESAELGEKVARYSFIGTDPYKMITLQKGIVRINRAKMQVENPLEYLKNILHRYKRAHTNLPKFSGGLLGYFAYDMVRYFEDIGASAADHLGHDDARFMFVKDLIAFDHWRDEILLISNIVLEDIESLESSYRQAIEKLEEMEALLDLKPLDAALKKQSNRIEVESNFEKNRFIDAVKLAKEHIYAGDIFQVVLSQRFEVKGSFDPYMVYTSLKEINPSPYMYLLDFGDVKIIGSSPEILVKVDGQKVTVRPIAGTRPRGRNIVEDEALAREMVNDEKERAEHLMLVDLGRNDVGRVSRFGSVEVTEFFGVEKYSHVQHIISNVNGMLDDGLDSFDALKAAFPAGTVSGAPKVRAMQIIEELEGSRRGIYAGCVGYFSFNGDMDFAITIRTVVLEKGKAYVQSGAGVVADSDPEKEYYETVNKGRGMIKALEQAGYKYG